MNSADACIACKVRRNWIVLLYIAAMVTAILYVLLTLEGS